MNGAPPVHKINNRQKQRIIEIHHVGCKKGRYVNMLCLVQPDRELHQSGQEDEIPGRAGEQPDDESKDEFHLSGSMTAIQVLRQTVTAALNPVATPPQRRRPKPRNGAAGPPSPPRPLHARANFR
jgi:hypothetical protein